MTRRVVGIFAWGAAVLAAALACNDSLGDVDPCESTDAAVTIMLGNNKRFEPDTVLINRQQTVCWENLQDTTHTVTFPDTTFETDTVDVTMPSAFVYESQAFGNAGDFPFYCRFHRLQGMTGVVRVR